MSRPDAHYPGLAAIDAYGNGGFRFAGMSHRGPILCLPSGIYAWPVGEFAQIGRADFARALAEAGDIDFLLLGSGRDLVPLPAGLRDELRAAGLRIETMATGAAARTYNVLLGEGRRVAAALIAVE